MVLNLYKILDVDPFASLDDIKKQYRFLIQAYHPDKFVNQEAKTLAEEKTKEINHAYYVLSDPKRRKSYDERFQQSHEGHTDNRSYKTEESTTNTRRKSSSNFTDKENENSGENEPKGKGKNGYTKSDPIQPVRFNGLKLIGIVMVSVLCISMLIYYGMGGSDKVNNDTEDVSLKDSQLSESSTFNKAPTSITKVPLGPSQGNVLGDPYDYFKNYCINWVSISSNDVDKKICVYGTVYDSYWGENVFFIRFSEAPSTFRFIVPSGYYFENIDERCVYATGEIKTFGDLPYIELDDRIYYCDIE